MFSILKRRSPRLLFAAWAIYWIVLLALLGRVAARVAAYAQAPARGSAISISATLGHGRATLAAFADGRIVAGGSMSLLVLALLIAGPPLLLWAGWLALSPRQPRAPVAPVALPPQRLDEWLEDPGYLDASSRRAMRQDAARRDASRDPERDDRER